MEILKKIDDLLIGWGISPSRADMLDQFIAFALILPLLSWRMPYAGKSC